MHLLELASPPPLSLRARINYSETYSLEMMTLLASIKNCKQALFTSHGQAKLACSELSCAMQWLLVSDLEASWFSNLE